MMTVVQDVLATGSEFPPLTKEQGVAAQQMLASIALTSVVQFHDVEKFLNSFTPQQQTVALKLEEKILQFLASKFIGPDGSATPMFIQEAEKQLNEMKNQPNHNNGIFKILQSVVSEGSKKLMKKIQSIKPFLEEPKSNDEIAHFNALIALNPKSTNSGKFKQFFPLVNQIVVYSSVVLPTLKAKKDHKKK